MGSCSSCTSCTPWIPTGKVDVYEVEKYSSYNDIYYLSDGSRRFKRMYDRNKYKVGDIVLSIC